MKKSSGIGCVSAPPGMDCRGNPPNRVVFCRVRSGITCEELAKKARVPLPWLKKLEAGRIDLHRVSLERALRIAEALGTDVKNLL